VTLKPLPHLVNHQQTMVAAVLVMRLTSAVPIGTTVVFSGLLVACGWMREYGNDLILFK